MPIRTFRGLLKDSGITSIPLSTNNGSQGYKIAKLQTIGKTLGTTASESILKIYKTPQTGVTSTVDFSDQTLLAVSFWKSHGDVYDSIQTVIFDREVFNQDVYLTHQDTAGDDQPINWYIELELVKLDLNENTVATLKDIRNINSDAL